jgi:hypothetical protein
MLFVWNCAAFACTSQSFHGGGAPLIEEKYVGALQSL